MLGNLFRPVLTANGLRTARSKRTDGLCPTKEFPRKPKPTKQISQASKVGCPIRRSMDQSSFAAPHGLSQRITSFFACACQGIHQMPLRHFIVLIANAHHLLDPVSLSLTLALEGATRSTIRTNFKFAGPEEGLPFTTPPSHDAIDVFDRSALLELRRAAHLRPIIKTSFSRSNPGPRG